MCKSFHKNNFTFSFIINTFQQTVLLEGRGHLVGKIKSIFRKEIELLSGLFIMNQLNLQNYVNSASFVSFKHMDNQISI